MHLNRSGTAPAIDDVVRATQAWYDREACQYGQRTSSYDRFPGLLEEITRFADLLADRPGPVLDLGCGCGRDTEFLLAQGFPVISADISTTMLRATATRCAPTRTNPVQLDMRRLPFRTNSMRGAWVCASLVHMPATGIPAVLTELHRVISPGGSVAISMKHRDKNQPDTWTTTPHTQGNRWFTYVRTDAFADQLAECGFTHCTSVSSNRGSWFIANGRKPESEA